MQYSTVLGCTAQYSDVQYSTVLILFQLYIFVKNRKEMPTPDCVYEAKLGLFRVLQTKGKSFSSGGFGVVGIEDVLYLFGEEALFLKEQELVNILQPDEVTPYTTSELYCLLLETLQIPLPVYLT